METVLYMVRHAQSPYIVGQERTRGLSLQGETDVKRITEIMSKEKVDMVISSPFARAILTVEGIAKERHLEIVEVEELKERLVGGDGQLDEVELEEAIRQSFEDKDFCLPGGESISQAKERAIPIITNLLRKYKGQHIVIGTHGNIMTAIMGYYDSHYNYDFWKHTAKPDIYKLTFVGENLHNVERLWFKG
ncbi:histidine phosphatase family protein [Aquibacillus kalidii]|uniref:histidine phosphatase family protein n=1 Tax=Aquibacillus kalidii TaxID=2762597 RepID=UPI0016460C0B|nr:histidine phosphatase family protein [Aquibacillus kalidii]